MHEEIARNNLTNCFHKFRLVVDALGVQQFNPYTAGGWVVSPMLGHKPGDMDLFFRTELGFEAALAAAKTRDDVKFETKRAVRLELCGLKVDLVRYEFSSPEKMIDGFDIRACMVGFDYEGNWFADPEALEDIRSRHMFLRQFTGTEAVSAITRVAKYGNRGLVLDRDQAAKLAMALTRYTYPVEMEMGSLQAPMKEANFINDFWNHDFNKADGRGGGGY